MKRRVTLVDLMECLTSLKTEVSAISQKVDSLLADNTKRDDFEREMSRFCGPSPIQESPVVIDASPQVSAPTPQKVDPAVAEWRAKMSAVGIITEEGLKLQEKLGEVLQTATIVEEVVASIEDNSDVIEASNSESSGAIEASIMKDESSVATSIEDNCESIEAPIQIIPVGEETPFVRTYGELCSDRSKRELTEVLDAFLETEWNAEAFPEVVDSPQWREVSIGEFGHCSKDRFNMNVISYVMNFSSHERELRERHPLLSAMMLPLRKTLTEDNCGEER